MTIIDHRGRDLAIIPDESMQHLPTEELLRTLFGPYLPPVFAASIERDKRHHFLRTQPIRFALVKRAF